MLLLHRQCVLRALRKYEHDDLEIGCWGRDIMLFGELNNRFPCNS